MENNVVAILEYSSNNYKASLLNYVPQCSIQHIQNFFGIESLRLSIFTFTYTLLLILDSTFYNS